MINIQASFQQNKLKTDHQNKAKSLRTFTLLFCMKRTYLWCDGLGL